MQEELEQRTGLSVGDLSVLSQSWEIGLRAAQKSERTVDTYVTGVLLMEGFLRDRGMPTAVASIRREHCEAWMVWMREEHGYAYASIKNRHCAAQQFFRWCEEEGEIPVGESPMRNIGSPMVPESPPPVLADEQITALLNDCKGASFVDRRDAAIVRTFIDTGLRLSELTGLSDENGDVDLQQRTLHVLGKGRRPRTVGIGVKTTQSIERYIRVRRSHPYAFLPELWLGKKGVLTGSGIRQMLQTRGEAVGIEGLHPHVLRHGFASAWLANGGEEGDLMRIAGWRSRKMLDRYGAVTAEARAVEAAKRRSIGDRF